MTYISQTGQCRRYFTFYAAAFGTRVFGLFEICNFSLAPLCRLVLYSYRSREGGLGRLRQ